MIIGTLSIILVYINDIYCMQYFDNDNAQFYKASIFLPFYTFLLFV